MRVVVVRPLGRAVVAGVVTRGVVAATTERFDKHPCTHRVLELSALGALHEFPVGVGTVAEALDVPRAAQLAKVLSFRRQWGCEAHAVHVLPNKAPLALNHGPFLILFPADAPCRLLVDGGVRAPLPVLPAPALRASAPRDIVIFPVLLLEVVVVVIGIVVAAAAIG